MILNSPHSHLSGSLNRGFLLRRVLFSNPRRFLRCNTSKHRCDAFRLRWDTGGPVRRQVLISVPAGDELPVKTATEVGVRAIQDHKVIEWNTCWKCRLSEGTDDK